MNPSSPQAQEMGDESMVRNLEAQAEAIWPQERPLFARYSLPARPRILDVGCGTGQITARLAELFPEAELVGVDLDEQHLVRARERCAAAGARVRFQRADILGLELPDASFDLVVCRHVLQAIPDPRRALAEMTRVAKPGAWLHLLVEDYGMLWAHPAPLDPDELWRDGALVYGRAIGTDLTIGRQMFTLLHDQGLAAIDASHLQIDTLRVPRDTFARIWEAWRDGYSASLEARTALTREKIDAHWAGMIGAVRDPRGYALWLVPIWSARKP